MNSLCRACYKKKAVVVYKSKKIPEYIWPSTNKVKLSKCYLFICKNCGHIQLQNFSPKKIRTFYGSKIFVIKNIKAQVIRKKTIENKLGKNYFKNKKILEIGAGTNPFLRKPNKNHFLLDFKVDKEILKKHKKNAISSSIETNKILTKIKDNDIVIMLHTLEHLSSPGKILKKLILLTKDTSDIIIEVPNFKNYIKKIPYYAVFHQHMSMFTEETLINLFKINGFKVKKFFEKKDNLFVIFSRNLKLTRKKKTSKLFYKNKKLIHILSKKMNIIDEFLKLKFNSNINIQGAGGSASLLINSFPHIKKRIKYAIDKDSQKINKIIPGTNIKIINKNYKFKKINILKKINSII